MRNALTLLAILAMIGSFLMGYKYAKGTIEPKNIVKYDTITYTIHDTLPKYTVDTLYISDSIPANIDTMAVVKAYYGKYQYNLIEQDSHIKFNVSTVITQNKPIDFKVNYKLLEPQPVSITKNRSLYIGFTTMPFVESKIKQAGIDVMYMQDDCYMGVYYQPYVRGIYAKFGVRVINW